MEFWEYGFFNRKPVPNYVEKFIEQFRYQRSPSGVKLRDLSEIYVGFNEACQQYVMEIHRDFWLDSDMWFYVPEQRWDEEQVVALRDRVYEKMVEHFRDDDRVLVLPVDGCGEFVGITVHIYIDESVEDGGLYGEEVMGILPEDW